MKSLALFATIFFSVAFAIWAAFAFITLDPAWIITGPSGPRFLLLVFSGGLAIPIFLMASDRW